MGHEDGPVKAIGFGMTVTGLGLLLLVALVSPEKKEKKRIWPRSWEEMCVLAGAAENMAGWVLDEKASVEVTKRRVKVIQGECHEAGRR